MSFGATSQVIFFDDMSFLQKVGSRTRGVVLQSDCVKGCSDTGDTLDGVHEKLDSLLVANER